METYLTFLLYLVLAEAVRRCCSTLLGAFTGPLAKVPGPFLSRFSKIPWAIELIKGNHLNSVGPLMEKYGNVVRIGKCHLPLYISKADIYHSTFNGACW
jgi:hypothetical protein